MAETHKKSRAIYEHCGRMFALLEEIAKRTMDPVFKIAARKMVREIEYEAGELRE